MTPLRQRFIEDMQLRGLAPATQRAYIHYVAAFANYFNTGPEHLDLEAVRDYQLYLVSERRLSPSSINSAMSAIQMLYTVTLEMPWGDGSFPRVPGRHKLPVVLSRDEVLKFFEHIPSLKYRAALMVCYGAGLRIGEATKLKLSDIGWSSGCRRARETKTATRCCPRACWRCSAPTGVPRVRPTGSSPRSGDRSGR